MKRKAPGSFKAEPIDFKKFSELLKGLILKSVKLKDIQILNRHYNALKLKNEIEKKIPIDQVFREIMVMDMSNDVTKIGDLINLSIEAAKLLILQATTPIVLLGDIFEIVTLKTCEEIFDFVENNLPVWKEDLFFGPCKNILLRICNDLLRRLSRTQNTVFCGRILLFLAKLFPFSERSGLNIVSEFNLENLTDYETDEKVLEETLGDTDLQEIPISIDGNLYTRFWELQNYFRNPNQLYVNEKWTDFSNSTEMVIAAFESFKFEEHTITKDTKTLDEVKKEYETKMEVDKVLDKSYNFFAKYLTNPKLVSLEFSDSKFRRSVLVQFLIIFQYLKSTVKFKSESWVLNAQQEEFVSVYTEKIYKLLEDTPPNGDQFVETVKHFLKREEIWIKWKNDGCKDFKLPETKVLPKPQEPAKNFGDLVQEASERGEFYMDNDVLTRLWNISPDNLQACKAEDRNFLPSLENFLEMPREKSDPSYEWRALRLLARQSPHFFTLVNAPSYKVIDYLDAVRKKLQKDKNEFLKLEQTTNASLFPEQETVALEEHEDAELTTNAENMPTDDTNTHKPLIATLENITDISRAVGADWKKLGKKLGYTNDEILYFESETTIPVEQCRAMLKIWFDDDDDASLENLAYILEGLGMLGASEVVKTIIDPPNRMEDISD